VPGHAASLRPLRRTSLGALAERTVVVALVIAFGAAAYAKVAASAENAAAASALSAALPAVHAYLVDHGSYEGMTLDALRREYGADLPARDYTLVGRGASGFCLESSFAGKAWRVTAETGEPSRGACG
jgi:hypothetical protein